MAPAAFAAVCLEQGSGSLRLTQDVEDMLVTGRVEIEAPIMVLFTMSHSGAPIMTLNGNSG